MNWFEFISWIGVLLSIGASITRALNIGFRRTTYVFSGISCIILIYDSYRLNSMQMVLLYIFHLAIDLIGIYRHKKSD